MYGTDMAQTPIQMTQQTLSDNQLDQQMDDTEEGEILEDGEIADEDEVISSIGDNNKTEEKENNNSREKDSSYNRDRDSRRRDSENRKSEDRNRDKDKDKTTSDRRSESRTDRTDRTYRTERRDGRYDRQSERHSSDRDRKSSSTDRQTERQTLRDGDRDRDRDRKTSSNSVMANSADADERRRKERDRKRRRSEEEQDRDRDERKIDSDKRKRTDDQSWSEYNNNSNNNNNNNLMNDSNSNSINSNNINSNITNNRINSFDDFDRRQPFDDFDFRVPELHGFPNTLGPMHERDMNDDEDLNFDERDFEEMLQIMEHRMPSNRVGAMDAIEKREMMRAMALMMKRNIDSDKNRRLRELARLRERRLRTNDRQPGPTGTRAPIQRTSDSNQRPTPFKQICKYFLEGKCHKGIDCPFSHDCMPSKKKELCKFYLQGFCSKGEDCLFMHSDFPCKFFHTNVECYSGDNCRFSHSPLTEETREILRNYLDSGTLPDDPKPDRQHSQHRQSAAQHSNNNIDNTDNKNTYKESQNQNQNSNQNESQLTNSNNSDNNSSPVQSTTGGFTPIKPVVKRHAILGDPTQDMKSSHQTWVWQQEMKELEVAYVGNKRNLFCIEKPFVMSEKPPTPRMEDDEEEIEAQIRNYYRDTMPEFDSSDTDHRQQQQQQQPQQIQTEIVCQGSEQPMFSEEQKLIEASAHDEDLRTILMRPRSQTNESINNDIDERSQMSVPMANEESQLKPQLLEVPQNVPKVGRDLYLKVQNKFHNESEVKENDWQSDSDDDDKNVLAAALKNVQQSSKQSSPTDKISKMLSIIRNSSNTPANQSPQQTEFWQNIISSIHINAGSSGSPSGGNSTPPRNDYRDPRLKRSGGGKESMSPSIDPSPPVKICDPNVKIEYKLVPIRAADIDYSTYVSIYRIDARLKNDPRLQKFFSKLPSSEIDNLSRIVPPPLKTAPVTPLSVLKSKKKSEKDHQKDNKKERTAKPDSPTLPPLPPLTISPSKSVTTPGIFPPTPPPIMSPLELISSRPTYTVGSEKTDSMIDTNKEEIQLKIVCSPIGCPPLLKTHSGLTSSPVKVEISAIESQIRDSSDCSEESSANNLDSNVSNIRSVVKSSAANYLSSDEMDIKPMLSSLPTLSTLSIVSKSIPLPQTLTKELIESTFDTTSLDSDIRSESDVLKIDEQMETASNYSTEDDLYDNLYPSQPISEDLSTISAQPLNKISQQKPISSSSSPRSSIDELELIRNELKGPSLSTDSDNEMEIDLRQRNDSVSEVESADECELMIASASETEDNIDSDVTNSSANNNDNNDNIVANDSQNNYLNTKTNCVSNESNNNNENNTKIDDLFEEPMNLSVTDVQNIGSDDNPNSDQSLKSVFSTIDPTASPFC